MTETVPETDDLIARLHSFDYFGRSREEQDAADALCREAATALEAAQARIAELEAERDRAIAGWSASQDREIDAYGCVSAARREALEEAAGVADGFPARQCGSLPVDPAACAAAVSMEIAAAIRSKL